jgi:hypothetical protein
MWPTLRPDDQVTVEPTTTDQLQMGDWVLLQGQEALFLHRFLGFTREGLLLTKGDGHRAPDSPWPLDALRGRAVAISRQGRTFSVSPSSLRERVRTAAHRLLTAAWTFLHRTGLVLFLLLGVSVTTVAAAVTLVEDSFKAIPQEDYSVLITWQTASETNMFGFYVQRAPYVTPEMAHCAVIPDRTRISDLIPSEGDIAGAYYNYTDASAKTGAIYYYCLEAVEVDGDYELHGPVTAAVQSAATTEPTQRPPTSTPTPSPTPTPSATPPSAPPPPPPTAASSPTSTPRPTSTPATGTPPTSTPTRAPTRTPTRTPVAGGGDEDTPTAIQQPPTSTPTPTAEPSTITATAVIPEPDAEPSDVTATHDSGPASQPTATPVPVAQATAISPTASRRPQPSPSPKPSDTSPTRSTANGMGTPSPWGLVLALIAAAGVLILIGGLGFWWMRQKK